jgi:uncharacterized protein (TIGR02246 family)
MRLALFLLLLAPLAFGQSFPERRQQCGIPSVESAIQKIAQDWKEGYNSENPAAVAALYAEDATYLTQHFATGIVHGRRAIQAYVKVGTDAKYKIESLRVLASGCSRDFAYAITRYDSINAGQSGFGVNLVLLRKIEGKWLIVAHESAVPDPSTAIRRLDPGD